MELLITMGIMAILIAVSVPAFRGFTQSANINGAVARVRSNIALARQWAITQRSEVNVIFLSSNSLSGALGNIPEGAGRLYRSMAVFVPTNTAGNGYYIKEWETLPAGFVFTPTTTAYPGTGHGDNVLSAGVAFTTPFPDSTSLDKIKTMGIKFRSDGSVSQASEVYIMPGVVDVDGGLTLRTNGPKFGVEIQLLTGQPRIRDYNL